MDLAEIISVSERSLPRAQWHWLSAFTDVRDDSWRPFHGLRSWASGVGVANISSEQSHCKRKDQPGGSSGSCAFLRWLVVAAMPSQPSLLLGPRLEGWHLANVTPGHPGVPVCHCALHAPGDSCSTRENRLSVGGVGAAFHHEISNLFRKNSHISSSFLNFGSSVMCLLASLENFFIDV